MGTAAAQVSALVLAGTFAWASVAKVAAWSRWRDALGRYRLGRVVEAAAAVGVPIAEIVVVVMLVVGAAKAGAALSIALISSFSLAAARVRAVQGDRLPCGCFGRTSTRAYKEILLRNAALGALAAVVLLADDDVVLLRAPEPMAVVPIVLTVAGIVAAGWLVWHASAALRRRT